METSHSSSSKRKRWVTESPPPPSPEPPAQRNSMTTPVLDHETWTNGNFEIITSDNVRFRIPDYVLFASSKVLADAHSIADGSKKIELMGHNETAHVLEMFLTFISEGTITNLRTMPNALQSLMDLASFMRKWDCTATLNHLIATVESKFNASDIDSLETFCFAAAVDNAALARIALFKQRRWGELNNPRYDVGPLEALVFDVRSWPMWIWRAVRDPHYLYALSRAGRRGDCFVPPDEFVLYLYEAKGIV